MKIITKYFYQGGTEIREDDLVYLKGYDVNKGTSFSGVCKIAGCNGRLLAYFLGQKPYSDYDIEMYFEDIVELVKLNDKEIEEALSTVIKNL